MGYGKQIWNKYPMPMLLQQYIWLLSELKYDAEVNKNTEQNLIFYKISLVK